MGDGLAQSFQLKPAAIWQLAHSLHQPLKAG